MFDSYMDHNKMNSTVADIAGIDGYRIVPRFNPGSSLPSDFAVIVVRFALHLTDSLHNRCQKDTS